MALRIGVTRIVADHVETFRTLPGSKRDWWALAFYLLLPIVVALGATMVGLRIGDALYPNLLTVAAVLVGLLLNALMLVQTMKIDPDQPQSRDRIKLRKELRTNISFAIVVSISLVGIIVGAYLLPDLIDFRETQIPTDPVLSFLALAALFLLGPAILIVLKRMYVVVSTDKTDGGTNFGG